MHAPTDLHRVVVKRVLQYLSGTRDHGILLLRNNNFALHVLSDADWGGSREYRAIADTTADLGWITSLTKELGVSSTTQHVIYCDYVGATYLSTKPVFRSCMKHVAIDYHFVWKLV